MSILIAKIGTPESTIYARKLQFQQTPYLTRLRSVRHEWIDSTNSGQTSDSLRFFLFRFRKAPLECLTDFPVFGRSRDDHRCELVW